MGCNLHCKWKQQLMSLSPIVFLFYSTLHHLWLLGIHCVVGCWDWIQDFFQEFAKLLTVRLKSNRTFLHGMLKELYHEMDWTFVVVVAGLNMLTDNFLLYFETFKIYLLFFMPKPHVLYYVIGMHFINWYRQNS